MKIDNKQEVGTDRLVNSIAAWNIYKKASIVMELLQLLMW